MEPTEPQIRRLVRVCRDRLGNPRLLRTPDGHPDSLALCIVDAVQSAGVTRASTGKVLARYRAHREAQGGNPDIDGAVALLGTFHDVGSAQAWARTIGNSDRASNQSGAPLKAVLIEAAANALSDIELYSAADLREVASYEDLLVTVHAAWTGAVGVLAAASWRHLLTLAGVAGVPPDRAVMRFVASALSLDATSVDAAFVAQAVERVADELGVAPTTLDHAAWRWQRAR